MYPTLDSFISTSQTLHALAKVNGVNAESDTSLIAKRNANNALGTDVPTATAPDISTLKPDKPYSADYAIDDEGNDTVPTWNEPNARYGGESKSCFSC